MALESLFHVVSVGDIISSPYSPQWDPHYKGEKKQGNEFIHDITISLCIFRRIKSNAALLKLYFWEHEHETWQRDDGRLFSVTENESIHLRG